MVCRNIAAGSLSQRLGLPEGQPLPRSIIEFYLKDDKLEDPMVSEEHITAFNWASTQEIDDMMALTLRVNDFLTGMFGAVGITLVDFKIEYGRVTRTTTPESSSRRDQPRQRGVGQRHQREMDKDASAATLGNVIESTRKWRGASAHEGDADGDPGRNPLVKATVHVSSSPRPDVQASR